MIAAVTLIAGSSGVLGVIVGMALKKKPGF